MKEKYILPTHVMNYILYLWMEYRAERKMTEDSCCCLMVDEGWMTTYQCLLQWKTQEKCCDE